MTPPLPPEEKRRRAIARMLHPRRRRRSAFETTRCADRTCGTCIRCVRARQWAEGKYANKRKGIHEAWWPPQQDARLRELAGTMNRRAIAEVLTAEFPDVPPRSAHAVAIYASRNGVSLWPPGHSLWEIGELLGVTHQRVQTWIDLGWLEPFPYTYRAGRSTSQERVTTDALVAFIRTHANHYDARRVKGTGRLADLARSYAATRTPRRFSRRHPSRREPDPEPTWFGRACPACEQVTFARRRFPSACRTCRETFEETAA